MFYFTCLEFTCKWLRIVYVYEHIEFECSYVSLNGSGIFQKSTRKE